jgi:hemolysin III
MASGTLSTTRDPSPNYSEEVANGVTHGIGTVLAVGALIVLATYATLRGNSLHVITCSIFGATLIFAYAASTLYHSIQAPRWKRLLLFVDHTGIFLLIAGTYTPFTLVAVQGFWGWTLFGIVWALAIIGIITHLTALHRWTAVSLTLYLVMGWTAVIAAKPIIEAVAPGGLLLIFAGGIAYTGGVAFFLYERLPYNHAIWHLFVLAGSLAHFLAILFYVIPMAGA